MITPTINLNGETAEHHVRWRREALDALHGVVACLRQITPNGRDYPGDPERCTTDRAKHYARLARLDELREELLAEALDILKQKGD